MGVSALIMTYHACGAGQVVGLTNEPVGMALYEMKDGQISNVCVQGGAEGDVVTCVSLHCRARLPTLRCPRLRNQPALWRHHLPQCK